MGQTQLVYNVGWGYNGIYRWKFRESKGVKVFKCFFLFHMFVFYYGVSMGIRVDNSIRLIQVVCGALRKGDKGLGFFFFFLKRVFFGWREEDGVIPSLSKGGFF